MTSIVNGIILKKQDYRENDRLFIIYTDQLGKIEAVAKGIKKIKSKMAGHLDLFSEVEIMVAPGKAYYQIAGADIVKNFSNLKSDFGKIVLGSYVFEIIDNFIKFEHADFKIYKLVIDLLEVFDNKENRDFLKLYGLAKFFVLKLLTLLGWTPETYNCVECKKKIIPDGNLFSPERGGLICGSCRCGGVPVSTAAIKILRFILQKNLKNLIVFKISKNQLGEVIKIVDSFLTIHKDKALKSDVWINCLTQSFKI